MAEARPFSGASVSRWRRHCAVALTVGLLSASVASSAEKWAPTSVTGAPTGRAHHTAVWTGSKMIVWGGEPGLNTGGVYDPASDAWTVMTTTNAPAGRAHHTAVWTGSKMIVWGGVDSAGALLRDGGVYDPATSVP